MKGVYLIILGLMIGNVAVAGEASCTDVSYTSSPGDYSVADPLCIIQAQVPLASFGYVRYYLPDSPYTGQEFTLQENSDTQNESGSYWDDVLQQWVDYSVDFTGGVGFEVTENSAYQILVDGDYSASQVAIFTKGMYIKVVFDGAEWVYSDGTF